MASRLSESLSKFLFPLLHTNRVVSSLPNLTVLFWRNLTSSSFISSSCNPKLFQSGAAGIQWPAGAVCPLSLWEAGLKVKHIHRLKLSKGTNKIFSSPSIDSQLLREASEFPDTELRALEILSSMETQGKEKLPWVLLHGCCHWLSQSRLSRPRRSLRVSVGSSSLQAYLLLPTPSSGWSLLQSRLFRDLLWPLHLKETPLSPSTPGPTLFSIYYISTGWSSAFPTER